MESAPLRNCSAAWRSVASSATSTKLRASVRRSSAASAFCPFFCPFLFCPFPLSCRIVPSAAVAAARPRMDQKSGLAAAAAGKSRRAPCSSATASAERCGPSWYTLSTDAAMAAVAAGPAGGSGDTAP